MQAPDCDAHRGATCYDILHRHEHVDHTRSLGHRTSVALTDALVVELAGTLPLATADARQPRKPASAARTICAEAEDGARGGLNCARQTQPCGMQCGEPRASLLAERICEAACSGDTSEHASAASCRAWGDGGTPACREHPDAQSSSARCSSSGRPASRRTASKAMAAVSEPRCLDNGAGTEHTSGSAHWAASGGLEHAGMSSEQREPARLPLRSADAARPAAPQQQSFVPTPSLQPEQMHHAPRSPSLQLRIAAKDSAVAQCRRGAAGFVGASAGSGAFTFAQRCSATPRQVQTRHTEVRTQSRA